jgi:hypothetical protein
VSQRQSRIVVLFALLASCVRLSGQTRGWDGQSTQLPQFWDADSKPIALRAPDGKLVLRVVGVKGDSAPRYFLEKGRHRLRPNIATYSSPYALWSPDSRFLAITSSDGGAVGNWKLCVYEAHGAKVVGHDVMKYVQVDLAKKFPAAVDPSGLHLFSSSQRRRFARDPSWVNVFGVRWMSKPAGLLVEAAVPGSSSYGVNMGQLQGYIIDPLSGAILRTYTEKELSGVLGD